MLLGLGLLCILGSFLVMVHHRIKHGYWLDWGDINNHETVSLALFCLGLGIVFGYVLQLINMG